MKGILQDIFSYGGYICYKSTADYAFQQYIATAMQNIFDKTSNSLPTMIATKYETIASLVTPIIITSIVLPISVKTFKWQAR